MEKFDINKKQNIYFIGIGGISMSAIAIILKNNGFNVSGSDVSENSVVKRLKDIGIKVNIGQKKENINSNIDIVCYSKAIHKDNDEYAECLKQNIPLISRSKLLGELMSNYNHRICISGTHGKTTTTSLISKALLDSKLNPTINIGGIVDEIGGNVHIGSDKEIFVAESCEYTNSFLDFYPTEIVITNIEADHLDFFKDINDIRNSFKNFVGLLPDNGLLVINNDIENIDYFIPKNKNIKVVTYGSDEKANFYYKNVYYDENYHQHFFVYKDGQELGEVELALIGEHNTSNFIAAFALLYTYGIKFDDIKNSVKNFKGVKRRLEVRGNINGITFIDDYAHHPTEIKASLNAIKKLKYNNMYLIFEPHTYSRTISLLDEFAEVLSSVDNLILTKIYAAREKNENNISSQIILDEILSNKNNNLNFYEYICDFKEISRTILNIAKKGDIVVTMGAGNVSEILDYVFSNKE